MRYSAFASLASTYGWVARIAPPECDTKGCLNLSSQNAEEERSVGDVVQGLHGGKYQFDSPTAGMTFAGEQFADALYGTDACSEEEYDENEPLPNWALRMMPPTAAGVDESLVWSTDEVQTVTIVNQERSWERYYAILARQDGSKEDAPFAIDHSKTGHLAPRGGASNVCDPSKPYSDTANIFIRCLDLDRLRDEHWWLLVGTEEEKWYYRLTLN
jgi:hypothetical protein